MSTLNAIKNTIEAQDKAKAIKVEPNSADTSLIDFKEKGVLISGSNATVSNTSHSGNITIESGSPNRKDIDAGTITLQGGHQLFSGSTNNLGGSIEILSGDGPKAGNIDIIAGDNTDNSASSITGAITIQTGGEDATSNQNTGSVLLKTGDIGAANKSSGTIAIKTGDPFNDNGSFSGGVTIETGGTSSTNNQGQSGNIILKTGRGGLNPSGQLSARTGDADIHSGLVSITTGISNANYSGQVTISTGQSRASIAEVDDNTYTQGAYKSGRISLTTGVTYNNHSGEVNISTGQSTRVGKKSGDTTISTGGANGYNSPIVSGSGDTIISTGDTFDVRPGTITLVSGTSHKDVGSGEVSISSDHRSNLAQAQSPETTYTTGDVEVYTGSIFKDGTFVYGSSSVNPAGRITGNLNLKTGTVSANGCTGTTGSITLLTGSIGDDSIGRSGSIIISSGDYDSTDYSNNNRGSGSVQITSGNVDYDTKASSGSVIITTGRSSHQHSGAVKIEGGESIYSDRNIVASTSVLSSDNAIEITGGDFVVDDSYLDPTQAPDYDPSVPGSGHVVNLANFSGGDIELKTGKVYEKQGFSKIERSSMKGDGVARMGDIDIVSHMVPEFTYITTPSNPEYDARYHYKRHRFLFLNQHNQLKTNENIYYEDGTGSTEFGTLYLTTPDVATNTDGGGIELRTGNRTSGSSDTGSITLQTGEAQGSGDGGSIVLQAGEATGSGSNGEIKAISNSVPSGTTHDQRLLGVQADGVLKALGIRLVATGTMGPYNLQSVSNAPNNRIHQIQIILPDGTLSNDPKTKVLHHWSQNGNKKFQEEYAYFADENFGTININIDGVQVPHDTIQMEGTLINVGSSQINDIYFHYILYETI